MKKLVVLICAAILCVGGCEANPEYPPAPSAGRVRVVNTSSVDFQALRFRKSTDINWSKDYLGETTIIPAGDEVTYFMPTGTFDFLVENIHERIFVEFKDITIVQGQESTLTVVD